MEKTEMARRYFAAYENDDRSFLDEYLARDFTFTSPFDEAISRDAYFAHCWRGHALLKKFHFDFVAADGDRVMVAYRAEMHAPNPVHTGAEFRNAECFTFADGKIKSVTVFFGDPPNGLTREKFAKQSGAA